MSDNPKISLCVIGKDEAGNLAEFWPMAKPIVDELVYVDTGSRDDSKEISAQAGAKVFERSWDDDFAAARNFSLEKATGDYILILDPDESITAEDGSRLKELLTASPQTAYLFTTRNYCLKPQVAGYQVAPAGDPHTKGAPGWVPSYKVRLFKNDPRIRFSGVVHETVDGCIEKLGFKTIPCDFQVHHYGQLVNDEKIKAKQGLRRRLGEKKVALEPDNYLAQYELGVILKEMGQYELALQSLERSVALTSENPFVFNALGNLYQLSKNREKAIESLKTAVALKPDYFDALYNLGVAFLADKHLKEAKEYLFQAQAIKSQYPPLYYQLGLLEAAFKNFTAAITNFNQAVKLGFVNWEIFFQLGLCLEKTEDFTAAVDNYHLALKINPKNAAAHCNLASIYCKIGNFNSALKEYEIAAEIDPSLPAIQANLIAIANYLKELLNRKLEQFLDADIIGEGKKAAPLAFEVEEIKNLLIKIKELLSAYYV